MSSGRKRNEFVTEPSLVHLNARALEIANQVEAKLEDIPIGTINPVWSPREPGRPPKGKVAEPTRVRSVRLPEKIWDEIENTAEEMAVSVNVLIEYTMFDRLHPGHIGRDTNIFWGYAQSVSEGPAKFSLVNDPAENLTNVQYNLVPMAAGFP